MATVTCKELGLVLNVDIKCITPQGAAAQLKRKRRNRRIAGQRVRRYAHAQKEGEWQVAQPIMVDSNGDLIDGQHRYKAVIESGKPTYFLVVKGYDPNTVFGVVDEVQPRRLSHWLEIQGEMLPDIMASVITMAARHEGGVLPIGGSGGRFVQTPIEGMLYLERNPKIRTSCMKAPGQVNRLVPRTMVCFSHYLFAQKDKAAADDFWREFVVGEGEGDALYLLRERMKSNRTAKVKLPRTEVLALVFKAWNAIRSGQKVVVLKWNSTGPAAEPFPEVK